VSRGLKKVLLAVGVAALAVAAAGAGLSIARTGSLRGYPLAQLHEGVSAATLQVSPAFVYRHGSAIVVLRPFAPDSPTPVAWCPAQRFFEDPETGSKWGADGSYLAGPATRDLDRLRSKVVGDVLQVAPGAVAEGSARQAERPATSEPPCDWAKAVFAPGVRLPASPTPEPTV
jgi:hypothetical protein